MQFKVDFGHSIPSGSALDDGACFDFFGVAAGQGAARWSGVKRKASQGFTTDNGNVILDVRGLQILNPVELETALNQITGVVTNGLFARRGADVLLLGTDSGIRTIAA